jgi:hypothetical protein
VRVDLRVAGFTADEREHAEGDLQVHDGPALRAHLARRTEGGSRSPRGISEPELGSGQGRGRTADTTIFSRVLYQLSYLTELMVAPRGRSRESDGRSTVVRFDRPLLACADLTGFEPAASTLTGWRALLTAPQVPVVVRAARLSSRRCVGRAGLEPATSGLKVRCSAS